VKTGVLAEASGAFAQTGVALIGDYPGRSVRIVLNGPVQIRARESVQELGPDPFPGELGCSRFVFPGRTSQSTPNKVVSQSGLLRPGHPGFGVGHLGEPLFV